MQNIIHTMREFSLFKFLTELKDMAGSFVLSRRMPDTTHYQKETPET